jgi:uncharacterized protein YeaO (DUF488 family)
MIKLQRVYSFKEDPEKGYSILVDRLWPRGIKKTDLKFDEWNKEVAPSNNLRLWFRHDPEKWKDFRKEYKKELNGNKELLQRIKGLEKKYKTILLLFAAKHPEHNHALVLKELLDKL